MSTHTVSKQRLGVFTVGGEAFACQQTNVRIIPPDVGDDAIEEVLDGTALESEDAEKPWKLGFTSIQDFTNDAGLQVYSWDNEGDVVAFSWQPTGAAGVTYSGMVQVAPLEVGGAVNKRLDVEAEWKLSAKPSRTPAA